MQGTRRLALAGAAVAGVVLGMASFAWACSPQARVSDITPGYGPVGTQATVRANSFNAGPVEIRWNSTGGPLLATATSPAGGGTFSAGIRIPDAPAGTYAVVAVQRTGGAISGKASVAFEVTPATATEQGGTRTSTGSETRTEPSPARSTTDAPSSAPAGETERAPSGTSGGTVAIPVEPAPAASTAPAASAARTQSAAPAASAARSDSTAGAAAPVAPVAAASLAAQEEATRVSARSGSTDMWSGFTAGTVRGASLDEAAPTGARSGLAVAGGVVTLAMLALLAGFGVAEVSRRRSYATVR